MGIGLASVTAGFMLGAEAHESPLGGVPRANAAPTG